MDPGEEEGERAPSLAIRKCVIFGVRAWQACFLYWDVQNVRITEVLPKTQALLSWNGAASPEAQSTKTLLPFWFVLDF